MSSVPGRAEPRQKVPVLDGIAYWTDGATNAKMSAPLEEFLNTYSYAAYYDSCAAVGCGFGGNKVRGGFFADAVIERYRDDSFWNRVANIGDVAGAVAIPLGFVPDPRAVVASRVLGLGSVVTSVGTAARSTALAETAASVAEEVSGGAVQVVGYAGSRRGGAAGTAAGAASVAFSQVRQLLKTIRTIGEINNDTLKPY